MAKKTKYKFFNSKLTSAVSVSMVLFLLGCTIAITMVARNMSASIMEKVAITIYIKDGATNEQVQSLGRFLQSQSYTKDAAFISKEQAIAEVCNEIGEDPSEFSDYNPLPDTYVVHVQAQYATNDSITLISQRLRELNSVQRVDYQKNMINTMERNVNRIALALMCATLLLLLISYVLIHNTMSLLIHSDRFTIHTMKLVGATSIFILKPYLLQSLYIALTAFVMAVVYIVGLNHFYEDFPFSILELHEARVFVPLFGMLLICSVVISCVATFFAVNKYLNKPTDDLYYI